MYFNNKRKCVLIFVWILVSVLASILFFAPLQALEGTEDEVKGAMLVQFIRFVKWPDSTMAGPNGTIVIGIIDENGLMAVLDVIEGRTIRDWRIHLKRPRSVEEALECHVLYMSGNKHTEYMEILRAVSDRPILTVGEAPDFIQSGGVVRFYKEKQRIRFEINPAAASRANLKISAKLLEIARLVE